MAFTYNPAQLADSPLFQVRFRLGDTDEETAVFQDEEINYVLSTNNNQIIPSCIELVSALLPRLASSTTSFTVGPYREAEGTNAFAYWTSFLASLKEQQLIYSVPAMDPPTGPSYFYYGMMGTRESSATDP